MDHPTPRPHGPARHSARAARGHVRSRRPAAAGCVRRTARKTTADRDRPGWPVRRHGPAQRSPSAAGLREASLCEGGRGSPRPVLALLDRPRHRSGCSSLAGTEALRTSSRAAPRGPYDRCDRVTARRRTRGRGLPVPPLRPRPPRWRLSPAPRSNRASCPAGPADPRSRTIADRRVRRQSSGDCRIRPARR